MIPNRGADCSQPCCVEMVGIMQSIPVIRSPPKHKTITYYHTAAIHWSFRTDWNHFADSYLRMYDTAARCMYVLYGWRVLILFYAKVQLAQTASLDQQDLCPKMIFFSNRSLPKSYYFREFYFTYGKRTNKVIWRVV